MPLWLTDLLQTVAVGIAGMVAVTVWMAWRASQHRRAVEAGRPVTFHASLRADAPSYPKRWRAGWLSVGVGPPTWKPRFSILRRPVVLPPSATVLELRRPAGWIEPILVNPSCMVMVVRAEYVRLELAVLEIELAYALRALESGTGGGWRVPRPAPSGDLLT
ncbi:MAG TPA: hypothetical protein VFL29_06900 [Candidatus Dormibacteraeota bacterium]|nr:hypothetical protein [Candidatus Dormibacteraeota bacterium]